MPKPLAAHREKQVGGFLRPGIFEHRRHRSEPCDTWGSRSLILLQRRASCDVTSWMNRAGWLPEAPVVSVRFERARPVTRQLGLAAQGDGASYRYTMPIIAPLARGVTMWSDQAAGGSRTRATSNADRLNHRAAIAKARV